MAQNGGQRGHGWGQGRGGVGDKIVTMFIISSCNCIKYSITGTEYPKTSKCWWGVLVYRGSLSERQSSIVNGSYELIGQRSQFGMVGNNFESFTLFLYPTDWEEWRKDVEWFREQNRIGKGVHTGTGCASIMDSVLNNKVLQQYGKYGPNGLIIFGIMLRLMLMLAVCVCVFMITAMVLNLNGTFCQRSNLCSMNNLIYHWSIVNCIDDQRSVYIQLSLWCVVSFITLIFTLSMRVYSRLRYREINNQNETDADYSIIVRGLPDQVTTKDIYTLIDSFEFYEAGIVPEVERIFFIYSLVEHEKKLEKIIKKHEKNIRKHMKREGKDSIDQQFKRLPADKLKDICQPNKIANAAIIRFNSSRVSQKIRVKVKLSDQIIKYFFPFYYPPSQYEVQGKPVSVHRAPEPTEIIWQNFGHSENKRVKNKILYTGIIGLTLLISAGALFGIGKWAQAQRKRKGQQPIGILIFSVIVTFIFNKLFIRMLIKSINNRHRLDTKTEQDVELMNALTFNESINLGIFTLFVPFLAQLPNVKGGVQAASLPFQMLLTIGIGVVSIPSIRFFLMYYEIGTKVVRWLIRKGLIIRSQIQSNILLKTPMISFVELYVGLVQLVWFGFIFGTVSPICLLFALIGVFFNFVIEKIMFFKKYSIPEYGSNRINKQFIDLLDAAPLLASLMNIFIHLLFANYEHKEVSNRIKFVLFFNLAVGIFILFMPWDEILSNSRQLRIYEDKFSDYKRANVSNRYEEFDPCSSNESQKLSIYPCYTTLTSANFQLYRRPSTINQNPESHLVQYDNPLPSGGRLI